jgi:glycosyltransferase involved in cell wall biosynthesis
LVTVLYAGNLGEGQGLHAILPALAKKLYGRVVFRVIGDGGRKEALHRALAEAGVENVVLLPPVKRDTLIQEYLKADVLFLHLNDYDAFKKVLPSKIFEYAAMGKPVWAGVSGYPAEFIEAEVANAAVFKPCDVDGAVAAFQRLELKDTVRLDFIRKFSRSNIMQAMAADICTVAQKDIE